MIVIGNNTSDEVNALLLDLDLERSIKNKSLTKVTSKDFSPCYSAGSALLQRVHVLTEARQVLFFQKEDTIAELGFM